MSQTKSIYATRKVHICAGHRVMGHENKCAHMHGHNYTIFLTVKADLEVRNDTDSIGRVIDFSVIKERIGGWIEREWDHGFILWDADTAAIYALRAFDNGMLDRGNWKGQKLFLLPYNPTAENMARYLLDIVGPQVLPPGVELTQVRVWETDNCYAEAVKE